MSNKSQYVLLNYDELNEKGLSKLVKERFRSPVIKNRQWFPAGMAGKRQAL